MVNDCLSQQQRFLKGSTQVRGSKATEHKQPHQRVWEGGSTHKPMEPAPTSRELKAYVADQTQKTEQFETEMD